MLEKLRLTCQLTSVETFTNDAMAKTPLSVWLLELITWMLIGLGSPWLNSQVMVLDALNTLKRHHGVEIVFSYVQYRGTHQKADSLGPIMVMASGS